MASTTKRRTLASNALATTLAAIVLLTLLGHGRLTDWDEGIYASISRAMLGGQLLVPHWNGQPWLEKPPLELWLTALSFRLFGINEFAARLTSALSGVVLVALLHGWLTVRRNDLTAWLNTLILLSTFGFLHVARVGEMDVLLSLGCTVALIGLCELANDHTAGWLLFWLGFAIALMTKGAASITLPITLILWLATTLVSRPMQDGSNVSRVGEILAFRRGATTFLLGLIVFLALTLPWHLAMLHRFGGDFTANYLGLHVLTRATTQIEGHTTPWHFYFRVMLLSAAPWVLLYPFALWDGLRRHALRPFALFSLAVVVLFSIAQTRLPHYIAPAYPALSVLTAAWLAERLRAHLSTSPNPRQLLLKCAATALACYGAAALLTAGPRKSLHTARLANGQTTPDNREQIALLKQVFQHPAPAVADIPGPLFTLRTGDYNPIPTTVFYSGRQVQQITLAPSTAPRDKYTNDPIPLAVAFADRRPHLLLADRSLLAALPATMSFQPIATSQTLALGVAMAR